MGIAGQEPYSEQNCRSLLQVVIAGRYFYMATSIFVFGLSRCSNDLPIHPGFWPTNNITIYIVDVIAGVT